MGNCIPGLLLKACLMGRLIPSKTKLLMELSIVWFEARGAGGSVTPLRVRPTSDAQLYSK